MHSTRLGLLAITLAIAAIIQATLGHQLTIFTARPDLVLLLVVTFSVVRGVEEGLLAGITGGLLIDCLSAVPFGSSTLIMGLIGLATGLGEANVYRANVFVPLFAVFLSTVIYHFLLLMALQAGGWNVEWISTMALQTFPAALINSILAPLIFPLVRRIGATEGAGDERFRW